MAIEPGVTPGATSSVLAVLVIYQQAPQDAPAWSFLMPALRAGRGAMPGESTDTLTLNHILVFDNSPEPQAGNPFEDGITYVHEPANTGTAGAYVKAFEIAAAIDCEWLLLLDHDTALPIHYLKAAFAACQGLDPKQATLLSPWVVHGNQCVSPSRLSRWGGLARIQRDRFSVDDQAVLTCIASGCLLNRSARKLIGPFPVELWLDYVDHWMASRVRLGGGVMALIDTTIQHHLSIEAPVDLSARRLRSILAGERYFIAQCGWAALAVYPLRLCWRALRYARLGTPHWRLVLSAWRHSFKVAR